ncbi:putative quinol monooxygenase [Kitasatospora sp. NPDC059327]|uniref:putative quinol monooxygenase n=1 Tax=Kitasatospora sp. NPDC059327 TaxID=3346803 RepID=UPI0036B04DF8
MPSNKGLLVRIEARAEHAEEVAALLAGALDAARAEERTVTWFAFREGPTVFGIFDTFADDAGRAAHLEGPIAAALMEVAPRLLASGPSISAVDVLAAKPS